MEEINLLSENYELKLVLKLTEARLRATIESLPFDFFAIDKEGYYIMQNATCKEHRGCVVGKTPEEVALNKDIHQIWKKNNDRAFSGEIIKGEVVYNHRGKDYYCFNIISPIKDNGKILDILGVNIDITEQKKAEKERIRLYEVKSDIITRAAHEMKTPLVPIISAVELLKRLYTDKLDEYAIDLLNMIERGCNRLHKLAKKLIEEFRFDLKIK